MKELSIEEKAKAYDEVRKKIAIRFGSNVAKEIFSQFEMSKDERIREAIIKFFELQDDNTTYSLIPKKDILVWLEKQGEQNTVEEKPYPETLEKAIELYYFSYGNGKGGFDNLSLEKFKDIVKTFVNDYGEQKPVEWSEEDERTLSSIYQLIDFILTSDSHLSKEQKEICLNWLNFLKERYTWKPSDEQMDALRYVTNFDYGGYKATLVSLYEQLKKLKG